jgi:ABC-2 type transport system ATP-binding protein
MAEISQTADHLVVIGRGRLITDTSTSEILAEASKGGAVTVRTPQGEQLRRALAADGVVVLCPQPGLLEVQGLTSAEVGTVAAREGIVLHELVAQRASLEDAFMRLTGDAVEYHALVGDEQPESAGVAA